MKWHIYIVLSMSSSAALGRPSIVVRLFVRYALNHGPLNISSISSTVRPDTSGIIRYVYKIATAHQAAKKRKAPHW